MSLVAAPFRRRTVVAPPAEAAVHTVSAGQAHQVHELHAVNTTASPTPLTVVIVDSEAAINLPICTNLTIPANSRVKLLLNGEHYSLQSGDTIRAQSTGGGVALRIEYLIGSVS